MFARKYHVPEGELEFTFARSSGPGGQNVNKVNSKAVLRWNLENSPSLPDELRERLRVRLASRLTVDGSIVVTSDRFRDQKKNRDDCIAKLAEWVTEGLKIPKARHETKPTRSSKRRNREGKSRASEKKKLRSKIGF